MNMNLDWEIGKEASELDSKPIKERMKIEKSSIKKIGIALILYSVAMVFFYIFL